MPKLILLNGNPGMGKSTLAQRYTDDHPMTLNLEVDQLWHMMGQWQTDLAESSRLKYVYSERLAEAHLQEGYDVIVPDVFESADRCERFERIAAAHHAVFKEVALVSTAEDAVTRCITRGKAMGYTDGFRPGGVLDTHGREDRLREMYRNILAVTAQRPDTIRIESVYDQADQTYETLLSAVRQ